MRLIVVRALAVSNALGPFLNFSQGVYPIDTSGFVRLFCVFTKNMIFLYYYETYVQFIQKNSLKIFYRNFLSNNENLFFSLEM